MSAMGGDEESVKDLMEGIMEEVFGMFGGEMEDMDDDKMKGMAGINSSKMGEQCKPGMGVG